jgi:hypothetical protein
MGSDTRRRLIAGTAMAITLTGLMIGSTPASAAAGWWNPVGLRGIAITRVVATGDTITVRTCTGATLMSADAGRTFTAVEGTPFLPPTGSVVIGTQAWSIDAEGLVHHNPDTALRTEAAPDPQSPHLGAGADLIAAPAAFPGVVVAVGTDGTVYRRGQDGDWKEALLLLPRSVIQGIPRVTSVTAFTQPLSGSIYLGTDGYAVLISTDGGDDWIRAGPGLPDSVYSLDADAARHAVYAGTPDGLWVHVLQAFPAPPAYHDAQLVWRWLGIGAVTIVAAILSLLGMLRFVPRRVTV